jgi:putative chitinase
MTITAAQLHATMPGTGTGNVDTYLPIFNTLLPLYEVNTPERVAGFLAQVAVESMQLARTVENLNYSSVALGRVFSKHFAVTEFISFANQPERIANRVYANRMGNGPEDSGDGWRYRGRGLIQITGKGHYLTYSRDTYKDDRAVQTPEMVAQPYDAVRSALWYWRSRPLNAAADAKDIRQMSLLVNGGLNGFEDRRFFYAKACTAFLVEGK